MELKDTISRMTSEDYIDRFVAEYNQLAIRHNKLKNFCNRIEASRITEYDSLVNEDGERKEKVILEPAHDCPLETLREQLRIMEAYMHVLELRAIMEGISLD